MAMNGIMTLIRRIACMVCGCQKELHPPLLTVKIDIVKLRNLLRAKFPDAQIFISDNTTALCNPHDIAYFLRVDKTNHRRAVKEKYDCDDFSYRLLGQFSVPKWSELAFGIVWTDKHALNCFVDVKGKFWFIEPQEDKIQEELKSWQGSKVRLVLM